MYCATRSVMTRQPAMTTITVMSAVSRTSQTDSAVDAEVVGDAVALDPGQPLDELHRRRGRVEAQEQRHRDQQSQHATGQRDQSRPSRAAVVADRQHHDAGEDRDPDRRAQQPAPIVVSLACR